MPPRPSSFEHDIAQDQKQNATEAMRAYLNSIDKQNAEVDPHQKSAEARKEIAKKASLSSMSSNATSPAMAAQKNGLEGRSSQELPRPRSKDIHGHAAAALAFDGSTGFSSKPAQWTGIPASARPTTTGSLFQRPGTAGSYMDSEGKARAQLSLAEQTKEFNEVRYRHKDALT
jgi:hypothetical protein